MPRTRFPAPATNPSDDRNRSAGPESFRGCRSLRTDDAKRSSLQNRAGCRAITTMRFGAGFGYGKHRRAWASNRLGDGGSTQCNLGSLSMKFMLLLETSYNKQSSTNKEQRHPNEHANHAMLTPRGRTSHATRNRNAHHRSSDCFIVTR